MPKARVSRALLVAGCACAVLVVAPAARAQAPEPPDTVTKKDSVYTADGLLGPVRVGPTVGIGAPDGLRLGIFTTWKGLLGAGGALSMIPTLGVPHAAPAQVSRFSGEGFLRVHPFRGAFFAGIAGGVAKTEGGTSVLAVKNEPGSRVALHASATAVYLAPHLGFRWMLPFGMTVGFDAGVEIPIVSSKAEFDATAQGETQDVPGKGKIATAMNFVASKPMPVLHLLEVGYAF
jgi:hypothetical protein